MLLHLPSNEHSSEGDNVRGNEESPKDTESNKETMTSIGSRSRKRFASKKLLGNTKKIKSKNVLGFLYTISTCVLNTPHFAYYEYKRVHYKRSYLFQSISLHHH